MQNQQFLTTIAAVSKRNSIAPVWFVVIAVLMWSTGGLFIKLTALDAYQVTFFRSLLAGLTVLIYVVVKNRATAIRTLSELRINGLGIFASIIYATLLFLFVWATKHTTAANAIFLQYTAPIYILILGPFVIGEKFRLSDLVTVIFCIAGMSLFFVGKLEITDYQAFFEELRSAEKLPTTSQPSVGDFVSAYEPILARGDDVVSLGSQPSIPVVQRRSALNILGWLLILAFAVGLSAEVLAALDARLAVAVVAVVVLGLVSGAVVARALHLDGDHRLLVGAGAGICGATAVAVVSSVTDVDRQQLGPILGGLFVFNSDALLAMAGLAATPLSEVFLGLTSGLGGARHVHGGRGGLHGRDRRRRCRPSGACRGSSGCSPSRWACGWPATSTASAAWRRPSAAG